MKNGWLRRDLRVALTTLVLLLAWEASGWDRGVAHGFGNAAGFVWRDAWVTRTVLHDGARGLGPGLLLLFALDTVRPWLPGPSRRERLFWLCSTVAAALLVPALKRVSTTSCPWDLAEFGGSAAYVPHWLPGVSDGGPGHCFPSGHAVTAFAFFSLYFLWRAYRPVLAGRMLLAVGALGLVFGLTQLVRGAHFPSHTFWSAWLCWSLFVFATAAQQAAVWWGARDSSPALEMGWEQAVTAAEQTPMPRR